MLRAEECLGYGKSEQRTFKNINTPLGHRIAGPTMFKVECSANWQTGELPVLGMRESAKGVKGF